MNSDAYQDLLALFSLPSVSVAQGRGTITPQDVADVCFE